MSLEVRQSRYLTKFLDNSITKKDRQIPTLRHSHDWLRFSWEGGKICYLGHWLWDNRGTMTKTPLLWGSPCQKFARLHDSWVDATDCEWNKVNSLLAEPCRHIKWESPPPIRLARMIENDSLVVDATALCIPDSAFIYFTVFEKERIILALGLLPCCRSSSLPLKAWYCRQDANRKKA